MRLVLTTVVLLGLGSASAQPPRLDRYGDPLPPGATARLGSLRLLCSQDVASVIFSPDGKVVAAELRVGGMSGIVAEYWDVASGRAVAVPADARFVADELDRRRKQWRETSKRLRAANPALTDDDLQLAVTSPTGGLLVTSSRKESFRIWDGKTLEELPAWPGQTKDRIDHLAFSPDGKSLAATSPRFTRIWDVGPPGKLRQTLTGLGWQSFSCTFAPDGQTLAVADGDVVTLWNLATGTPLLDFGHTYTVGALAFTPDGKSLLSGASYTDQLIHRWNPHTGERLATWRGHTSAVYALATSRDGRRAISASYDGTCRLWEVATGRDLGSIGKHSKPIWSADLAPDGRSVATVEGDVALVWPVDGSKPLHSFRHDGQRVMRVAFSPDGRHLLTLTDGSPGVVRLWDLGKGTEVRRLPSPSGARIDEFVLSRDGRQVLTGERTGVFHLWDYETGQLAGTLTVPVGERESSMKWAIAAFSPDGRCLVVGASDGSMRLVESATGQERLRWEGHKRGVVKVLFSPDGALVASGSWDRTILTWDVFAGSTTSPADLAPLWIDLGADGMTAYRAMRQLMASGDRAAALFARHLRPATAVDPQRIAALVANLESDRFTDREAASKDLAALGDAVETTLRNVLKGSPTAETRRRVEALLATMAQPTGDRLRAARALEVLERLATPAARQVLKMLAEGAADAPITKDGAASLKRLEAR